MIKSHEEGRRGKKRGEGMVGEGGKKERLAIQKSFVIKSREEGGEGEEERGRKGRCLRFKQVSQFIQFIRCR